MYLSHEVAVTVNTDHLQSSVKEDKIANYFSVQDQSYFIISKMPFNLLQLQVDSLQLNR